MKKVTTMRFWTVASILAAGCVVIGCEASAPGKSEAPPSSTAAPPAPASAAAGNAGPATLADLFPPGPSRDAVLNNCGSCHNLACATIGQRTNARWDSLRESHKEKVAGADVNAMFEYLKANFNEAKPEPKVPPKFLEGGCTPF